MRLRPAPYRNAKLIRRYMRGLASRQPFMVKFRSIRIRPI